MTVMRVAVVNGAVLTYDTEDVQDIHIETPRDVHDLPGEPGTPIHRELGQEHLTLRIDFKDGTGSRWIDQAYAVLPDLRATGDTLTAALTAEGVPPELASRVWNRFFFAAPDGPDAVYRFDHEPVDCPERVEVTKMRDREPQWMDGRACTEAARVETPLSDALAQGQPDKFARAVADAALRLGVPAELLPPSGRGSVSCPDCEPFGFGGRSLQSACGTCQGRGYVQKAADDD